MIIKNKENKIFIIGIAKLEKGILKLAFIRDFQMINDNYKGLFVEEITTSNCELFDKLNKKSFNRWYRTEVDLFGNILCLYIKKRKINI